MTQQREQDRLEWYVRRLATLVPSPTGDQTDALVEICDVLPDDGEITLVGLVDGMASVGFETGSRRSCPAPPLSDLIVCVVKQGEGVSVASRAPTIYADARLDAFRRTRALVVTPIRSRTSVVAALCYVAAEIPDAVRRTVDGAAAAIGLRLSLSSAGGGESGVDASLASADVMAAAGLAADAITTAAQRCSVRAELLPAVRGIAALPGCGCPYHRDEPITVGGDVIGWLLVHSFNPIPESVAERLLSIGRVGLLVQRAQGVTPVSEPSLLAGLTTFSDPQWASVGAGAKTDLTGPVTAVLVARVGTRTRIDQRDLLASVSGALGVGAVRAPMATRVGQVLVLLARHDTSGARRVAHRIVECAADAGVAVSCFVSEAGAAADVDRMVHEVERLALVAPALDFDPGVTAADDVGLYSLLLDVTDAARLSSWALRRVGLLVEYDETHASDLVRTLEAYLRAWGHLNECASRLYVHPNTLKYRIRRIQEISEVDPRDSETRLELLLACCALRATNALGHPSATMTSGPKRSGGEPVSLRGRPTHHVGEV